MHKRTAHRWRLLSTMMVGIFFAFGSFWLLQLITNGDLSITPDTNKSEPDYIVEKFSFVRMTTDGKPRYMICRRQADPSADRRFGRHRQSAGQGRGAGAGADDDPRRGRRVSTTATPRCT